MFSAGPGAKAPDGSEQQNIYGHYQDQHRIGDGLMDEENRPNYGDLGENRNVPGRQDAGTGRG